MRSNTRLVCMYMLVMMLLRFHDNLILTTKHMETQTQSRQLGGFTSILYFFLKLLLAAILIGIGIALFWYVSLPILSGVFVTSEVAKLAFMLFLVPVGLGIWQVIDIKRVCFDNFGNDDVDFFGRSRRLSMVDRRLTQDKGATQKASPFPEIETMDVNEFKQMTKTEIVFANAEESLKSGRAAYEKIRHVFDIEVQIRNDYLLSPDKQMLKEPHDKLGAELKALKETVLEEKASVFKRRLARIVVATAWQFLEDIDKEINPTRFQGKQKEKYEKLLIESRVSDPAKKKKALDEIAKMTDKYKNMDDKTKQKLAKTYGTKLYDNGLALNDFKSNYVIELIAAVFPKINKVKMAARKEEIMKLLENSPEELKKFKEMQEELQKAEKPVLHDNTKVAMAQGTLGESDEHVNQSLGEIKE